MKQYANATGTIAGGYDAIQEAVDGKSVSDVKAMSGKDKASDAVSSATLADTLKYLELNIPIVYNTKEYDLTHI